MKNIFITGTSTDIGKTLTAALLLSAAHAQGIPLHYLKPIQTGSDCDSTTVKTLTGLTTHVIMPLLNLKAPRAPYCASQMENVTIDVDSMITQIQQMRDTPRIIEGAGGLLVPITKTTLTRDFIKALGFPLIVVANTQLGTLNHTLLTLQAAEAAGIPVLGLILSGAPQPELVATLLQFIQVPILAEIPWIQSVTPQHIQQLAPTLFTKEILCKLVA
jgi:dethiobiotin synthetase